MADTACLCVNQECTLQFPESYSKNTNKRPNKIIINKNKNK